MKKHIHFGMAKKISFFLVLAVMVAVLAVMSFFAPTPPAVRADGTATFLAGDKDGFGIGLPVNANYADMNAFTPEVAPAPNPDPAMMDRPLVASSWGLPASELYYFTSKYAAKPSTFGIITSPLPAGAVMQTATLKLMMGDIDDGEAFPPLLDDELFIDGQAVAGAFDNVSQYLGGVAGKSGVISIVLNNTLVQNAMADNNVNVLIDEYRIGPDGQPIVMGRGDEDYVEIFALDYAELVIDYKLNPCPRVDSISPSSKMAGEPPFTLTVTGSGFVPLSIIHYQGLAFDGTEGKPATVYQSPTQLKVFGLEVSPPGYYFVTVVSPPPGGGSCGDVPFLVNTPPPTDPPPPGTGSIRVNKATIGGDGNFLFSASGQGYSSFSIATVNGTGSNIQSGLISGGEYGVAEFPQQGWSPGFFTCDNGNLGAIQVVAGQTTVCAITNTKENQVESLIPTITSLSPPIRTLGDPSFTLTVIGTNYVSGSVVRFDNLPLPTTYISATKLSVFITTTPTNPAVGKYFITVVNPDGATSNEAEFVVEPQSQPGGPSQTCNPKPIITNIIPSSKNEGDPGFTLTVNGSNFLSTSVIYFDGPPALTTNITNAASGVLTASIATTPPPGTYYVTVVNPSICPNLSATTGNNPISVNLSANGGLAQVANYNSHTIQRFDADDLQLSKTAATQTNPRFLATDRVNGYVYVVNNTSNTLQKLTAGNLTVLAQASTESSPTGVAVSSDGNFVYVTNNADSTLQKFDATGAGLTAIVTVPAGQGAYALALSPGGEYVYVINNQANTLQKFSATNLGLVASTATGISPVSLAISPGGSYIYVANTTSGTVQKFNASDLSPALTKNLNSQLSFVTASPDGNHLYVSNSGSTTIQKLRASDLGTVASVPTDSRALSLVVSDDSNFVYAVNYDTNKLQKFYSTLNGDGGTSDPEVFTVNANQQGSLKIIKNTTGGNGSFNYSISGASVGSASLTTSGGTGATNLFPANPGTTYQITEAIPNGWKLDMASCDQAYTFIPGSDKVTGITVIAGQTTTCTFSNTKISITPNTFIKINKEAAGGNATFNYVITGPSPSNKNITTVNSTGSTGAFGVAKGTYAIVETLPADWDFTAAACDNGSGPTGSVSATSVTGIEVIAGQTTTCVFGNIKDIIPPGTALKIIKNTSGGNEEFNFTVTGPTAFTKKITTFNGTGIGSPNTVEPGTTYQIAETVPAGWTFIQEDVFCDNPFTATANGATNITVVPGQTTTCMFKNKKDTPANQGWLKIIKNSLGGNETFNLTITGPQNSTPSITTAGGIGSTGEMASPAGTYQIVEIPPAGWEFHSASCDNGDGSSEGGLINAIVVVGETTTCTYTNMKSNYVSPTALQVIKNTIGGDEAFDFHITATPSSDVSITTQNGVGATGPIEVAATAELKVHETFPIPAGWALDSVRCTNSFGATGAANPTGIVNVAINTGQTTVCTFTNKYNSTPQTSLKIIKNTSGGNGTFNYNVTGPTSFTSGITTVDGTGVSGPTPASAGATYQITESAPAGWTLSSVSCDNNFTETPTGAENIAVAAGEVTTCIFGNLKNNTGPYIEYLDPDEKFEGDLPFTLNVIGTGFIPTSVIYFPGPLALRTTYVSPTKLTTFMSVPPVNTYNVTVVNPAPNGGTSNAKPFTVNSRETSAVYANNLDTSSPYCPVLPDTGLAYFYWNYQNDNGNRQKQFQLQVAENSSYSQPLVDRTVPNLSNPPGTLNQQAVKVKLTSTNPAGPGSDFINYNDTYYWRVKVWEKDPATGGLGSSSGWIEGQAYSTFAHPGPYAGFTFAPGAPSPQSRVSFTSSSVCYNVSGPAACQSYGWDFGDSGSSSLQNPAHTYAAAGTFLVKLKVYDATNNYCEAFKTIPVFSASGSNGLPRYKEISPF